MLYRDLALPTRPDRPFFYSNFVQTVDGKVQVRQADRAYWPIGSAHDYATLVELRAHADVLIHGKNTALEVRTLDRLGKPEFQERRKALGKVKDILYVVVSAHPDEELWSCLLTPPTGTQVLLVTSKEAKVPEEILVLRLTGGSMMEVSNYLQEQGYKQILVEGGPGLFASFLEEKLIDELFLTIAPRIFGSAPNNTLTLVENKLFAASKTPHLHLITSEVVEDELYLRYSIAYENHSSQN